MINMKKKKNRHFRKKNRFFMFNYFKSLGKIINVIIYFQKH